MKKICKIACLALTALFCAPMGGCRLMYRAAFREEYKQYDKVWYVDDTYEAVRFRDTIYRKVSLDESSRKSFSGYYYCIPSSDTIDVGIDGKMGTLYKGCSPVWGTLKGTEEVCWLARDGRFYDEGFLREDITLPTLEECALKFCYPTGSVYDYEYEKIADKPLVLEDGTCIFDIVDKDFPIDFFALESYVGEICFRLRDFQELYTLAFDVYQRKGDLYLTQKQYEWAEEQVRIGYRVQDEYQYLLKGLLEDFGGQTITDETGGGQ